jgi:hypothetical protein
MGERSTFTAPSELEMNQTSQFSPRHGKVESSTSMQILSATWVRSAAAEDVITACPRAGCQRDLSSPGREAGTECAGGSGPDVHAGFSLPGIRPESTWVMSEILDELIFDEHDRYNLRHFLSFLLASHSQICRSRRNLTESEKENIWRHIEAANQIMNSLQKIPINPQV